MGSIRNKNQKNMKALYNKDRCSFRQLEIVIAQLEGQFPDLEFSLFDISAESGTSIVIYPKQMLDFREQPGFRFNKALIQFVAVDCLLVNDRHYVHKNVLSTY